MSDDAGSAEIIRRGYDTMAERFEGWRAGIEGSPEDEWLDDLLGRLPGRAEVLELGCGQGLTARTIVDAGHGYTGVDISAEQLRKARERVPETRFREADFTELDVEAGSLDAIISIYVFNHVPRSALPRLHARIHDWLRPGGFLLATFGRSGSEGVQDDWLGVPMFFASYTDDETRALLRDAGFEIERDETVQIVEPDEGEGSFLWIMGRAGPRRLQP